MIISASYKTDIPAFYGEWFRHRRDAGFVDVRNVWNGKYFRVSLRDEDCGAFVYWTRNARPFGAELARTAETRPLTVQYTITGSPRWLERAVPDPDHAAADLRDISARYGPDAAVWRYDPVLVTNDTPADWHIENFNRLADRLAGTTNEVVVSFAQIYRKTRRNLDRACEAGSYRWTDPGLGEKRELLAELDTRARARDMTLTLCTQPDLVDESIAPARCIDAGRLNRVAAFLGHERIDARTKGLRDGCLCAEARDIGAYDTCSHGCVYCYAVSDPAAARRNQARHRPTAETLDPSVAKVPAS